MQFPDAIRQLKQVTQLYVSVDAATRDSLKAVDRPLFKVRIEQSNKNCNLKGVSKGLVLTNLYSWTCVHAQSTVCTALITTTCGSLT